MKTEKHVCAWMFDIGKIHPGDYNNVMKLQEDISMGYVAEERFVYEMFLCTGRKEFMLLKRTSRPPPNN